MTTPRKTKRPAEDKKPEGGKIGLEQIRPYLIGAGLGALGLALVPLTGVLPHRADEPETFGWYHWLSTRQAVTLRSLTAVPPALDDPAMLARAAGHYELVCAACHGSPAGAADRIAADLTPLPPRLTEGAWRPPARLFQSVTYGHRQSAMPAWPTPDRPDEVWDMVAFVGALPDLSATDYAALAGQGSCTDCHGDSGEGRDGMPRLDTLTPAYIAGALQDYRAGIRPSGTMIAVARGLTDADIADHAARFGQAVDVPIPADDGSHGAALALRGDPARDIPACLSCHETANPARYPAIIGQEPEYLRRQLHLFVPEEPGHDPVRTDAPAMVEAARELEPEDIEALVDWLSRP